MITPGAQSGMSARVMPGLKGFQQRTVDYVFKRMYEDPDPATRFLVADEVGLGKTLVARGVIAKAIDHLQATGTRRIDVIYICSNAEIAGQNISRLNVTGERGFAMTSRITLLPRQLRRLNENALNFVSFTPGTSFRMASRTGISQERAVILRLLEYALEQSLDRDGAYAVLRGTQDDRNFRNEVYWTPRVDDGTNEQLDRALADAFRHDLKARPELPARFLRLTEQLQAESGDSNWNERLDLILELRKLLARSCVRALEADLVILDEFQRFRELLEEPNPEDPDDIRQLAHHLFTEPSVRILLLSATPYKMFTLRDELQDDHYADFLKTARFLMGNVESTALAGDLSAFRRALVATAPDQRVLRRSKTAIERRLRRVMCRTERLAVTADRGGMLGDRHLPETRLDPRDLSSFAVADRLSRRLGAGDSVDYWKSAPYLLNFMESYKLKAELVKATEQGGSGLHDVIDPATLLSRSAIEAYERVDPGNALLRGVLADTVGRGTWRLLWIPPACPYYRGGGPYAEEQLATTTKRLVFSSWNVVPDAVSVMLSYEAERQMMRSRDESIRNVAEERAKLRGLLSLRRQKGEPATMSTFAFMYPSVVLAEVGDPLRIARALGAPSRDIDQSELLALARARIETALSSLTRHSPSEGLVDARWYWAAPLLLDRRAQRTRALEWLTSSLTIRSPGGGQSDDEDEGAWSAHVWLAISIVRDGLRLGRPPADLADALASMAVGGPANCALRAIARVQARVRGVARIDLAQGTARDAAIRIAWGFRTLYNVPEVMWLLRGPIGEEDVYWKRAADEGVDGNLQAVLDEYLHVLPEWLGILDRDPAEIAAEVGQAVQEAVSIRAVNYQPDEVVMDGGGLTFRKMPMRVRYALRFGRDASDDKQRLQRSGVVRSAFNSPFWPFVLTSTSVGQEGLDFHQYCHAVVHWNLPSNPVDLEQREGRVHRYKGHAIRRNVAARHGAAAFGLRVTDPWEAMFVAAQRDARRQELRGIEPFWVYEGPARIERHVPMLPLSREVERLPRLRQSLAAYRLVFGQPRQEDLLAYLHDRVDPEHVDRLVQELRIDLSP